MLVILLNYITVERIHLIPLFNLIGNFLSKHVCFVLILKSTSFLQNGQYLHM